METEFVVLTSTASNKGGFGPYMNVAVLEVEKGYVPCRIDERLAGVVQIVQRWRKVYDGVTDRCAGQIALASARELAAELNAAASLSASYNTCIAAQHPEAEHQPA